MTKQSLNAAVGDRFPEVESYDWLFNSDIVNLLLKTNEGGGWGLGVGGQRQEA